MMTNKRNWQILVLCTYFSLGAFALISQTIMLREFFVVVYGNEFIFGVLLTNWLVGIFTGALTGGTAAEKMKNNLLVFVISILVMCAVLPLAVTLTRLLYILSSTPPGSYISFFKAFLYSALFIIPISFFIGFVFPIAAKVQIQYPGREFSQDSLNTHTHLVKGISNIYIFEALGSLFSGAVYTFFLVGHCNAYMITALTLLPLLICCGLILLKARYYKTLAVVCIFLIFTLASLFPAVNSKVEALTVQKRWSSISTMPLVYSTDSRYQNIAVAKLFNQYNLYLNTMLAAVFPNDEDNLLLAVHLICQHPAPQRLLIVGDAVSGLAKALLPFKLKEIISVEIDAKSVAAILKFLPPEDKKILTDPRFKILLQDGREYVKDLIRANEKPGYSPARTAGFDIVYINISEPSTLMLNRFYTREFFSDLSRVMSANGVVALKITSSENYEKGLVSDYTASVFHTVKSVFPEVVVTPGVHNFLFAAKDSSSVTDSPDQLAQRYAATRMKPERLGLIFYSLYPTEKTRFIKKALQISRIPTINTDDTPITTLYFNKIIGWYGRSNLAGLLGFFEKVKFRDITVIILVLFLVRMFYLWGRKRKNSKNGKNLPGNRRFLRFHTLLAVFSGGLAGLSLEMVILYTFQNYFGNIYHIIGLIIAVFMFGLPLGALAANALISRSGAAREEKVILYMMIMQSGLAGIAFLFPFLTRLFAGSLLGHQMVIFAGTILIGFGIGLIFPLALRVYLGEGGGIGKTAGVIDAFDHIGAAVGAFFIGTLFLPVMGVSKICSVVALFPLITAFFLFTDWRDIKGMTKP